jgi:hypothetical protein
MRQKTANSRIWNNQIYLTNLPMLPIDPPVASSYHHPHVVLRFGLTMSTPGYSLMKFLALALSVASIFALSQPAQAVLITRNVGLDNLGTAGTINSVTITNISGGDATNSINVSISVLELGSPFTVGFTVAENSHVGVLPILTPYQLTVTLTNAIVRPGSPTGRPISGFDLDVNPSPAGSPFIVLNTPPGGPMATSDTFAVESPNLGAGFRFGGLNGGGGELYFGQTAISTIELASITTANGVRNFGLQFTANPEPASLLLGGLLLGPAGVIAARRRRKQANILAAVAT